PVHTNSPERKHRVWDERNAAGQGHLRIRAPQRKLRKPTDASPPAILYRLEKFWREGFREGAPETKELEKNAAMFRSPTITSRKYARHISPSDARAGCNTDLCRPENSPAPLFLYEDSGPQILPLPFCHRRTVDVTSD